MAPSTTPVQQRVRINDVGGRFFAEVMLLVVPRLGQRLTLGHPDKSDGIMCRVEEITARRSPGVVDILVSEVSSNEPEPSHPAPDVMRRFCERYAYQTRHGTELGGDLVFEQLMNYVRTGQLPQNDVHSG